MDIKDKLNLMDLLYDLLCSKFHTKETAIEQIAEWIMEHDRGR
jgi:hypothetical protein